MKRLFLLCLIFLAVSVSAEQAIINKDRVWIKSRPETGIRCFGTTNTKDCLNRLDIIDGYFDVLEHVKVNDVCPNWSKVRYHNRAGYTDIGYICDSDLTFIKEKENNITILETYSNKYGLINKNATWFYPSPAFNPSCEGLKKGTYGCVNRLDFGDPAFKINYKVKSLDNTCKEYYHITYANKWGVYTEGFMCTSFIKETTANNYIGYKEETVTPNHYEDTSKYSDAEFINYLTRQGFPADYHAPLLAIHKKYPKWQFSSYIAADNFNTTVKSFMTHGRVTIQDYNRNSGFLKTDGSFKNLNYSNRLPINQYVPYYNYLTNTFAAVEGSTWFQVSEEGVAYYMDPRNYLNENSIFAFTKNTYDNKINYSKALDKLIGTQNTLYKQKDVILKASKDFGVSASYIAAQIIQETNRNNVFQTSGSPFYLSDNKTKVSGFYNYFNIMAFGNNAALQGLRYAYHVSWDTRERSIRGGTAFISGSYITRGQNTPYTTKFNVHPVGKNITGYGHGYMADARAPLNAGRNIKKAYQDAGLLNEVIYFDIPVYKDMPAQIKRPRPGNPNNYLREIKINNKILANFDPSVTDYIYKTKDSSITISASPIIGKANIKGTGNRKLNYKEETITLKVEAENGHIRNYNIKVIKENKGSVTPPNVTPEKPHPLNKTYLIKGNYIHNLGLNKYASDFLKEEPTAKISSSIITTGTDININNKKYKAVVYGDINGDNAIDLIDMLILKRYILKYEELKDYNYEAADIYRDGKVDLIDLLVLKRHILKYETIKQG